MQVNEKEASPAVDLARAGKGRDWSVSQTMPTSGDWSGEIPPLRN